MPLPPSGYSIWGTENCSHWVRPHVTLKYLGCFLCHGFITLFTSKCSRTCYKDHLSRANTCKQWPHFSGPTLVHSCLIYISTMITCLQIPLFVCPNGGLCKQVSLYINWCLKSWKLVFRWGLCCIWIQTIWYAFSLKGIPDGDMVMWPYGIPTHNIMHTICYGMWYVINHGKKESSTLNFIFIPGHICRVQVYHVSRLCGPRQRQTQSYPWLTCR